MSAAWNPQACLPTTERRRTKWCQRRPISDRSRTMNVNVHLHLARFDEVLAATVDSSYKLHKCPIACSQRTESNVFVMYPFLQTTENCLHIKEMQFRNVHDGRRYHSSALPRQLFCFYAWSWSQANDHHSFGSFRFDEYGLWACDWPGRIAE